MIRQISTIASIAAVFAASPVDLLGQVPGEIIVSSEAAGTLLVLGAEARALETVDPMASEEWHLAFFGTDVVVNGGEGGPGQVVAYCVCQNEGLSGDELQMLSPETELSDFEAVGISDLPANDAEWGTTTFATSSWYRYNLAGGHRIWPSFDVYLIRSGDELYKVQILGYYADDGTPRQVRLRYAPVE